MDHFVSVDKLPADFTIPPDLGDRLRFILRRGSCPSGLMSKADFDRLCQLTRNESWSEKLEDLFQVCIDNDDAPVKPTRNLLPVPPSGCAG